MKRARTIPWHVARPNPYQQALVAGARERDTVRAAQRRQAHADRMAASTGALDRRIARRLQQRARRHVAGILARIARVEATA